MQKIQEIAQNTLTNLVDSTVEGIQFILGKLFHIILVFTTDLFEIFSSDIHYLSASQIKLFSLITAIFLFCSVLAKIFKFIVRTAEKLDRYFERTSSKLDNRIYHLIQKIGSRFKLQYEKFQNKSKLLSADIDANNKNTGN